MNIPKCYAVTYKNMHLIILKEDQRYQHGGYKYLIRTSCTPHTAFRTKHGLKAYMSERGLLIGKKGFGNLWELNGEYTRNCMMLKRKEFETLFKGKRQIRVLDNGECTPGYISANENGSRCINFLNVNCDREILQYDHN